MWNSPHDLDAYFNLLLFHFAEVLQWMARVILVQFAFDKMFATQRDVVIVCA